jgi:hypothetical protein
VDGALLARTKAGGWESVAAKSDVPADRLLVALFGAELQSANGAVDVKLVADVGQRGPFPVLEAAARFHASTSDLEVTLERGIMVLVNKKKAGAAKVRLKARGEVFDVVLSEPNARLGVEVYGRHVPGPPNLSNPKLDNPVTNVLFFALAREAVVSAEKYSTRLQAPPGNALLLWDSVTRTTEVRRFEKLPDYAKPFDEKERKQFELLCHCTHALAEKPGETGKTLEALVLSKEPGPRKVAVVALGALDDLPRLLQVLNSSDSADARDMAVLVMRNWLGRTSGQSILLYDHLTKKENYTPTQAKNLLYLFNGIEEERLKQPATYDTLIGGLNHSKMPMRELARWHLVRLVPDGKSIAYDAAAAEPQRMQAIEAWRRLVPEGELPAPFKKKS